MVDDARHKRDESESLMKRRSEVGMRVTSVMFRKLRESYKLYNIEIQRHYLASDNKTIITENSF